MISSKNAAMASRGENDSRNVQLDPQNSVTRSGRAPRRRGHACRRTRYKGLHPSIPFRAGEITYRRRLVTARPEAVNRRVENGGLVEFSWSCHASLTKP